MRALYVMMSSTSLHDPLASDVHHFSQLCAGSICVTLAVLKLTSHHPDAKIGSKPIDFFVHIFGSPHLSLTRVYPGLTDAVAHADPEITGSNSVGGNGAPSLCRSAASLKDCVALPLLGTAQKHKQWLQLCHEPIWQCILPHICCTYMILPWENHIRAGLTDGAARQG